MLFPTVCQLPSLSQWYSKRQASNRPSSRCGNQPCRAAHKQATGLAYATRSQEQQAHNLIHSDSIDVQSPLTHVSAPTDSSGGASIEHPDAFAHSPGAPQQQPSSQSLKRGRPRKDAEAPIDGPEPTELVFVLERRGDGWGEEIIPHLVVENRPITKKSTRRRRFPAPWEPGSLERMLLEVGVAEEAVDAVAARAVSWRVTPGGRHLVDRRRRSRVERNMKAVTQHLLERGIKPGPQGVGAVLTKVPELLLCKPTTNDRWDRRVVELAAFWLKYGHCNVPEDWTDAPGLSSWVKRQRVVYAEQQLSEERLVVLQALGFEFGEVAQMTDEWERKFDQLLDWVIWNRENNMRLSWLGLDWGARGGITARQLSLWVQLQREFRRRNLLSSETLRRLKTMDFQWEPQEGTRQQRRWVAQLGRLLHLIERHKTDQVSKIGQQTYNSTAVDRRSAGSRVGREMALRAARGLGRRYRLQLQLEQEIASRRAALACITLEPGLGFWLAKQRWLWRHNRLDAEQVLMLELAGVELGAYPCPLPWGGMAALVAQTLVGSCVPPLPEAGRMEQDPINDAYAASALAEFPPRPLSRVTLRRWVWTQRQLWKKGQLSASQLRYLTAAGILWALSEEVVFMKEDVWQQLYAALAAEAQAAKAETARSELAITAGARTDVGAGADTIGVEGLGPDDPAPTAQVAARSAVLQDWLQQQRALRLLGLLSMERELLLAALGVDWQVSRTPEDQQWDRQLGKLLHLHAAGNSQAQQDAPLVVDDPDLAQWLTEQAVAARHQLLSGTKLGQLKALGVKL